MCCNGKKGAKRIPRAKAQRPAAQVNGKKFQGFKKTK